MAATFAMDSDINSSGFSEMAEEEFKRVPVKRKAPDNVVELPRKEKG